MDYGKRIKRCFNRKTTNQEELQVCADLIPLCRSIDYEWIAYVYSNLENSEPTTLLEGVKLKTFESVSDYLELNPTHVNALYDGRSLCSVLCDQFLGDYDIFDILNVLRTFKFNPNIGIESTIDITWNHHISCSHNIMLLLGCGLKIKFLKLTDINVMIPRHVNILIFKYGYTMTTNEAIEIFEEHTSIALHFLDDVEQVGYENVFNKLNTRLENHVKRDLVWLLLHKVSDDPEIRKRCIKYVIANKNDISEESLYMWFDVMTTDEVSQCVAGHGNSERITVYGNAHNLSVANFKKTLMGFSIPHIEEALGELPKDYRVVAESYVYLVKEVFDSLSVTRCKQAK